MKHIILLVLFTLLPATSSGETTKVKYVIDGDTFITSDEEKVRMLGINATEREEWFYQEAKDYLKQLIQGKQVELIKDSSSPNRDKHGRLLRYVHLGSVDINEEMILSGYTYAFLRYNIDRKSRYGSAEKQAQKAKLGLWSTERPKELGPVPADQDNPAYILYGILGFIALVLIIQTWRYFR